MPNNKTMKHSGLPKAENVDRDKTASSAKGKRKNGTVTTSGNSYKLAMTPRT